MKLISVKLPKRNTKNNDQSIAFDSDERWPYGLRISFEAEQLKNLPALKNKTVGDKCIVYAEADIISTRESERQNDKKEQHVELQIKKLNIKPKIKKAVKDMNPGEYREYRKTGGGK